MEQDVNKVVAAILTTMMRRPDITPSIEQVLQSYDRMLRALIERDEREEG